MTDTDQPPPALNKSLLAAITRMQNLSEIQVRSSERMRSDQAEIRAELKSMADAIMRIEAGKADTDALRRVYQLRA